MNRRRRSPIQVSGVAREVYHGRVRAGRIVQVGATWRAIGAGGTDLGRYAGDVAAERAVLLGHATRCST